MSDLEEILKTFDTVKDIFRRPLVLSQENPDIIIKYPISMLQLAPRLEKKEEIMASFAQRFQADVGQLTSLLQDEHNWMDYLLYTAFSVHCQQQLELDDDSFYTQTARKTFLNYQDSQIQAARFIPLNMVLGGMSKQFKNWTKVTKVEVEKLKKGQHSFRITRQTKPEYRQRMEQSARKDITQELRLRDCPFTLRAFEVSFQELFGQQDLRVERTKSEGEADEYSEYVVHPSRSYQSILEEKWEKARKYFMRVFLPWKENKRIQVENDGLKQDLFEREQTIQGRTDALARANAQLERRQELIVQLLGDLQRIKSSGQRHAIVNFLQNREISVRATVNHNIAEQLYQAARLYAADEPAQKYLQHLCEPFGIPLEALLTSHQVELLLSKIKMGRSERSLPVDDLFADFFAQEIYLANAYETMQQAKTTYALPSLHPLSQFDPFSLLFALESMKEVFTEVNARFANLGQISILDKSKFSDAVRLAKEYAQKEKRSPLDIQLELSYDPVFNTNGDALVYMVRDLMYNAIDSGASAIRIIGKRPAQEEANLPHLEQFCFKVYPSFYAVFEDNGSGIPDEKAKQLNDYLEGAALSTDELSTKGKEKGGLGTKNMKDFFRLHNGHGFYERYENGTRVHTYFERLEI